MTAYDDYPILEGPMAKGLQRRYMCDEIDRLRAENETLGSMHTELMRRNEVLTEWQRDACEWLDVIDKTAAQHALPPVPNLLDLLRRAGVEVD